MTQTPKARFMEQTALAKQFLDVVDSEAFTRACELAFLQFFDELSKMPELKPSHVAQRGFGAARIIEILKALPEPPKPLAPRPSHNLDHKLV